MRGKHDKPIRIVVFTSLYPNAQQPRHGIFVEQRLRHLVATGAVEARVVAPVPWFWSTHPRYGRYAKLAAVAPVERRHGLEIMHPRYLVPPKVGMTIVPTTMAKSAGRALAQLQHEGFDFDLIDAHYFYPDGVAAIKLSKRFDKPVIVTARGADINSIANMPFPRRQIRNAAREASALVGVSDSLSRKMLEFGVASSKITTLRNGVDLHLFSPAGKTTTRADLEVSGKIWLCVGHMIERKGMHIAIEALGAVPDVTLIIAGDGPEESALRQQVSSLSLTGRVRFVGAIEHADLPSFYNGADALILPTRSEGMPNVVLEALACGTAVIATAVDGIPEVMTEQITGRLLQERTAASIVSAWRSLTAGEISAGGRRQRREFAQSLGWDATTAGQLKLFRSVLGREVVLQGQNQSTGASPHQAGSIHRKGH